MDDFLSPIAQGLAQGLQLRGLIEHHRLQSEALQRQKVRQAREDSLQDLQTKMSLLGAGAKPVSADGTYQAELPGGVPLTTALSGPMGPAQVDLGPQNNPLDSLVPQRQAVAVPTDPGYSVKFAGQSYRLPTLREKQQEAEESADRKAVRDRAAKRVALPGVGDVDAGAVPYYTAGETQKSIASRQKEQQAFTGTENEKGRLNSREIAELGQSGQDERQNRQQTFQHGENALTRAAQAARASKSGADDGPKPLNPLQAAKIEGDLKVGMAKAESLYTRGVIAETNRARKFSEGPDPDTIGKLTAERDQLKQLAHDGYREKLAGAGITVDPIDFAGQTNQRLQAKTLSKAQLSAFAKQNKLTDAKASELAKKQGYTVE